MLEFAAAFAAGAAMSRARAVIANVLARGARLRTCFLLFLLFFMVVSVVLRAISLRWVFVNVQVTSQLRFVYLQISFVGLG